MDEFTSGKVQANGIEISYVEKGTGPLVLFCHGFPESWFSWRHQIPALAAAGYRAVALDMRGYGGTSKPEEIEAYNISNLVGDVVQAVTALGESSAVIVGHDWGAPVAWYSGLMRPDVFRAVIALSVPYSPPAVLPMGVDLNQVMKMNAGERDYYRLYFQEPGIAEADLEADVRKTMLGFLYTISGDIVKDGVHAAGWDGHFPMGETASDQLVVPEKLPVWLSEEDLQFYVKQFSETGFRGGLNWYRNIKRIPSNLAPFLGEKIGQPTLYLYGEHDMIAGNTPDAIEALSANLPDLRGLHKLLDAGHWLQQERPHEVNAAIIDFLSSI